MININNTKTVILTILERIGKPATKIKKAPGEDSFWCYVDNYRPFLIDTDDLRQGWGYIEEYLKCILDLDFNADILCPKEGRK